MKNKKVFVVVEDGVYDYESSTSVQVFDTKEKAVECVADLKRYNEDECLADGWELEYAHEDEFLFQEPGDYTRNHYLVTIWEQEVK